MGDGGQFSEKYIYPSDSSLGNEYPTQLGSFRLSI
jgi:hypothetical protein